MAIKSMLFKNETEKFIELIEANKMKFYKTAKAILKNDEDVADVIQDALIKMYECYDELKDKKLFSTWGTRIVINKCYDLIRKNKLRAYVPIDDEFENTKYNSQNDLYDLDEYGIKKVMDTYLSEDIKLVTILYYYNDFSINEISETLNIPSGTVKSRLAKAREILKSKLENKEV